ncbi:type IV pilin [Halopenitus persicus]|uniref:type IV pilin n=1 Tax=Halopenitus persicus TaxID=1048396 RepID=UPI000BBB5103|nr:type IV pilin [Halopenitus persicus]
MIPSIRLTDGRRSGPTDRPHPAGDRERRTEVRDERRTEVRDERRPSSEGPRSPIRSDRAFAPIGVVLLILLTTVLAGGSAVLVTGAVDPIDPAPTATLSLSVQDRTVTLTNRGGDALSIPDLRIRIRVDGDPLREQPPVPFFSAAGYEPGPTGAFNSAGTTTLGPGERASFRIAGTNDPVPEPGSTVELRVFDGEQPVARLTATAA